MKLIFTPIVVAVALLTTGCASTSEYQMYSETQKAQFQANAIAEAARWNALAKVAENGDTAAKVAVAMAVATNNSTGGPGRQQQQIAAPKSAAETALQWTSLLLPSLTQFYSINQNSKVAITQSNNSTALGMRQSDNQATVAANTNAAFVSMNAAGLSTANTIAGAGFTAVTNVASTGFATTANVANTGMNSIVSVANTGSTNMTTLGTSFSNTAASMTNATSNAISNLANTIPLLQPIVFNTSVTTNNECGATVTGGTLTCP